MIQLTQKELNEIAIAVVLATKNAKLDLTDIRRIYEYLREVLVGA